MHKKGDKTLTKHGKSKKTCAYCTKKKGKTWYGHTEEECREKIRDKKKAKEENNAVEEDDDESVMSVDKILRAMAEEVSNPLEENLANEHTLTILPPTGDLTTEVNTAIKGEKLENSRDNTSTKITRTLINTGCSRTIVRRENIPDNVFKNGRILNETE